MAIAGRPHRHCLVRFLLTVLLFASFSGCSKEAPSPVIPESGELAPSETSAIQAAVRLYNQGQLQPALRAAENYLVGNPSDATALSLIVQIHSDLGDRVSAAEAAESLAEAMPEDWSSILVRAHYWYIETKRFSDAERLLKKVAAKDPAFVEAQRSLAALLCAQGRRHEAVAPLKQLIRLQSAQPNELLALVDLKSPFQLISYELYYEKGDGSQFNLSDALYEYVDNEPDRALRTIQRLLEREPDCVPAIALKGRILIECGRQAEYDAWLAECPKRVLKHPDYWSALGLSKQLRGDFIQATEAYGRAIELDPTDRNSLRGLAECLEATNRPAKADRVRERLSMLERIFRAAKGADAETAQEIAEKLQKLTRPLESTGWLMRAMELQGNLPQQRRTFNERIKKITAWETSSPSSVRQKHWLQSVVGLEDADRAGDLAATTRATIEASGRSTPSAIRFVEQTEQAALPRDQLVVIPKSEDHIPFLYQTTGAGVAVLDYDLDGRADIYEARCLTKPLCEDAQSANQLYRQSIGQTLEAVTRFAGVDDYGFGQGVASGDLNQDGFPDLLIANFGENRLYMNQGDGTFRRSNEVPFDANSWTTSFAIADLSGDGLPEIIEVNYIDDPAAPTRPCPLGTSCTPQEMIPAEDQFYRCLPTGTFERLAKQGTQTASYGMGVVVADFTGDRRNDVFVGNDAEYNQFWQLSDDGSLGESALARGCAVGRSGNSQACMGIASGDFNGDGQLDLHVTNFLHEPANLFVQTTSGTFADQTLKYGLFDATFSSLGFGSQACDFDNDGNLDLVTLNGHVYGDPQAKLPFRMTPQLFRGGLNRFDSVLAKQAGPYFEEPALGRSLALLDWGRDGDFDLVATHLDRSLGLIENTTMSDGHWLQLELVGTTAERQAIGAKVTVRCQSNSFHAWRTAGDGYLSTNESVLHFGLGDNDIKDLTVLWPSGLDQHFSNVKPDHRYRVVEGQDRIELVW